MVFISQLYYRYTIIKQYNSENIATKKRKIKLNYCIPIKNNPPSQLTSIQHLAHYFEKKLIKQKKPTKKVSFKKKSLASQRLITPHNPPLKRRL
jgi:hypothetical protein